MKDIDLDILTHYAKRAGVLPWWSQTVEWGTPTDLQKIQQSLAHVTPKEALERFSHIRFDYTLDTMDHELQINPIKPWEAKDGFWKNVRWSRGQLTKSNQWTRYNFEYALRIIESKIRLSHDPHDVNLDRLVKIVRKTLSNLGEDYYYFIEQTDNIVFIQKIDV